MRLRFNQQGVSVGFEVQLLGLSLRILVRFRSRESSLEILHRLFRALRGLWEILSSLAPVSGQLRFVSVTEPL